MVLVLALLLMCSAVVFVVAEQMDVWKSIYLTLITALTIGYGDITPKTAVGQLASVLSGFLGVIIVGVVVAITTKALSTIADRKIHPENRKPID